MHAVGFRSRTMHAVGWTHGTKTGCFWLYALMSGLARSSRAPQRVLVWFRSLHGWYCGY